MPCAEPAPSVPETRRASTPGGIRLGDLEPRTARVAASPALADRILAAAAARLAGSGSGGPPPRKLAVLAAALAHVTLRRAGTSSERTPSWSASPPRSARVDDAVAEAVLEAARAQPATAAELAGLAAELSDLDRVPVEIAALAKLLNAMADGEAALRRLRDIGGMQG